MAGYTEEETTLARQLAEDDGFDPDHLGTDHVMASRNGITAIPHADFVRPIWQLYLYDARKTLQRVDNLRKNEVA